MVTIAGIPLDEERPDRYACIETGDAMIPGQEQLVKDWLFQIVEMNIKPETRAAIEAIAEQLSSPYSHMAKYMRGLRPEDFHREMLDELRIVCKENMEEQS